MKSVGNIGGTLYCFDTPIVEFKCIKGVPAKVVMLTDDRSLLPIEFWLKPPRVALLEFLVEQVTPETRYGIDEDLAKTPIGYYHVERMLRYSHGYNIDGTYWIKQDEDNTCWIGTDIEGKGIPCINSFYELDLIKRLPKTSVLLKGL